MIHHRASRWSVAIAAAGAVGAAFVPGLSSAASTTKTTMTGVPPYAISLSPDYDVLPILSAGDLLPVTGDATKTFKMVGIPDGLGARRTAAGNVVVYMSQELTQSTQSEPVIGEPLNRGAFVTKLILAASGAPLSADRAYDDVYLDDALVGPAADLGNSTPGFTRFCSGFLAGKAHGFDTPIYFANEEGTGSATFDGKGGLAVAIFNNQAHALTDLAHFAWENSVIQPRVGSNKYTVAMCMEDGASNQDPALDNSQLYMYVGIKDPAGATVLERNGLVGGTLYVFRALDQNKNSELLFQSGTLEGEWVAIPGADAMTDVELEAASDAAGAMLFVRPEDGCFNPRNKNNYFFVTTGGLAGANELGRLYSMRLNKNDPTRHALLTVAYNADTIVAAGGDIALSPDNIDASQDYLMICEDGTTQTRAVMTKKGRDGSIWRFDLAGNLGVDATSAERVVELDPPGRDGAPVGAGVWETSGIIDATGLFGDGWWLFDVQAHSPTAAPAPGTVEDGQLLLLRLK